MTKSGTKRRDITPPEISREFPDNFKVRVATMAAHSVLGITPQKVRAMKGIMKSELKSEFTENQNTGFIPSRRFCLTDPMHYIYLLLWVGFIRYHGFVYFPSIGLFWSAKS